MTQHCQMLYKLERFHYNAVALFAVFPVFICVSCFKARFGPESLIHEITEFSFSENEQFVGKCLDSLFLTIAFLIPL